MSEPVAYLLGELDEAQAAAFERVLATDPELRAEVERLRPVVARLEHVPAEAWEEPAPPPLRGPVEARPRRRLVLRPLVAAACGFALLAAGLGIGTLLDRDPAPAGQLALRPLGAADPGASGRIAVSDDGLRVRVSGLQPTARGEFYELWLLGADQQLVALGSFRVDAGGAATLDLPLPVDPGSFEFFDVSLEPGDGDPGHSGASVLRGPVT